MREASGMFLKDPDKGSVWGKLELLSDDYQQLRKLTGSSLDLLVLWQKKILCFPFHYSYDE